MPRDGKGAVIGHTKTNRVLRLSELMREHSVGTASVVFATLPVPHHEMPPQLHMSWLEQISDPGPDGDDMPPVCFIRGNNENVLTFYS